MAYMELFLFAALGPQQLDHLLHFLLGDINPLTHLVAAYFTHQQFLTHLIAELQLAESIFHGILFELFRSHLAVRGDRGYGLIQLAVIDA